MSQLEDKVDRMEALMEEGISPEAVQEIPGAPAQKDTSRYRRNEIVNTYGGQRLFGGSRLEEYVNFYRDAVVTIETL